ncbi:hypothetical protein BDP27DRAFT_1311784 [Rhodocollybia butyracea]|uniref:Uncharacterized protein n=1 Tax=Rhodocollybia butyracea TaxID=206335 RepID=A0A9P5UG18_9AGAR|nr:hypothetical protein BDP27DRAFT_1311784 [Rhodocollybia butyracea]
MSNEYARLPTSEPISLIHPLQNPTASVDSTVSPNSDIPILENELSRQSLPKVTDEAQVFQSAPSAPDNVSNPYSKDMDIADALATKVRDKLLSEINSLAWRTFLFPVSAHALFFFVFYLTTSPSAPAESCNCSNISTFQPLNSTLPTPISTEIWREKIHASIQFFFLLVCYNVGIVLLIFRTIRGGISSKIDIGMALLKLYIGNNQYQYASDQPLRIHRYTQYSGLMRPDPRTWEPKTTFYKGGWSNLAWAVASIGFPFITIFLWAGPHLGAYEVSYVLCGIFGLLVGFTVQRQRLDISGTVTSDEKVVWGLCEEVWMAMGMDAAKLRGLSQVVGVWESGVGIV